MGEGGFKPLASYFPGRGAHATQPRNFGSHPNWKNFRNGEASLQGSKACPFLHAFDKHENEDEGHRRNRTLTDVPLQHALFGRLRRVH